MTCDCDCHNEKGEPVVMDACGGWGATCCEQAGRPRSKLTAQAPAVPMSHEVQHTTRGGKGAVGRIKR